MILHRKPKRLLLTDAPGYIDGRSAARLLKAAHRVRCLVRAPLFVAFLSYC